jgi:hypothetical protein
MTAANRLQGGYAAAILWVYPERLQDISLPAGKTAV